MSREYTVAIKSLRDVEGYLGFRRMKISEKNFGKPRKSVRCINSTAP